jgi:hypothetical protein
MYYYGNLQTHTICGPETQVILTHPHMSEAFITINAIVDTGAAISAVPESAIDQIRALSPTKPLPLGTSIRMKNADGVVSERFKYRLHISIVNQYGVIDYSNRNDFLVLQESYTLSLGEIFSILKKPYLIVFQT